jgi:hypothetical protein
MRGNRSNQKEMVAGTPVTRTLNDAMSTDCQAEFERHWEIKLPPKSGS